MPASGTDPDALLARLRALPLIASIEDARWQRLAPHIGFRELDAGGALFRAGTQSENLYLVLDGCLDLELPPNTSVSARTAGDGTSGRAGFTLQSRRRGDTAGDFAVLNGGQHIVDAIAREPTCVAAFPAFAFELLSDINPRLLAHVYDTAAALSRRAILARVFLDLFGRMAADRLHALLEGTTTRHLRRGELLFREGDSPDGLYVVVSGRLMVRTTDSEGHDVQVGEVRAPFTIGELGVLAGTPRNATVDTVRESTVAFLDARQVETLIAPHPEMLLSLARLIMQRSIDQARRGAAGPVAPRNIVVLPLDSRLPLRRFLQQLRRELRHEGEVLMLDARGFDTLYGKRDAAQTGFDDRFNSAIADWLDDKENRHERLLYVGDAHWSEWTRRCVHRADRILLVADATVGRSAALRTIERDLGRSHARARWHPAVELVLLHPRDTAQPAGTRHWLRCRSIDAYHHVRLDDARHMARLARRLTGRARGIVFSGGGARGYAHLGVQRLIEETGYAIDCIGGSSMGGLLGASMARGESVAAIEALSARFANRKALFDYTLPLVSLMASRKLTRFCREVYGDTRIEDLWVPFFCVSSDLDRGVEVVHDRGRLWRAVRSTVSLPGVFAPVPAGAGRLLIDGAILNTFPVDVMQRRLGGQGYLIGVNVSQLEQRRVHYDYGTALSGWRVLLSRLNPFVRSLRVPRVFETLLRSTDIKSVGRMKEVCALLDVHVEPDTTAYAMLDFRQYAAISEIGYEAAVAVFARHGLLPDGFLPRRSRGPDAVVAGTLVEGADSDRDGDSVARDDGEHVDASGNAPRTGSPSDAAPTAGLSGSSILSFFARSGLGRDATHSRGSAGPDDLG